MNSANTRSSMCEDNEPFVVDASKGVDDDDKFSVTKKECCHCSKKDDSSSCGDDFSLMEITSERCEVNHTSKGPEDDNVSLTKVAAEHRTQTQKKYLESNAVAAECCKHDVAFVVAFKGGDDGDVNSSLKDKREEDGNTMRLCASSMSKGTEDDNVSLTKVAAEHHKGTQMEYSESNAGAADCCKHGAACAAASKRGDNDPDNDYDSSSLNDKKGSDDNFSVMDIDDTGTATDTSHGMILREESTHEREESQIQPLPDARIIPQSIPGAHHVRGIGVRVRPSSAVQVEVESLIEGAVLVESMGAEDSPDLETGVDEEAIEGTILKESQAPSHYQNNKKAWICAFISIWGIFLLLILIFILPSKKSGSGTPSSQNQANSKDNKSKTPILYPPFQEHLPPGIVDGLKDFDSHYYSANAWMVQDPFLDSYSPTRQMQRFLLASFYYQFNGTQWFRNDNWLSYYVSECHWFNQNSSLSIGGWHPGMEPVAICDEGDNLLVLNLTSNNLQGFSTFQSQQPSPFLQVIDGSNNPIMGEMPLMGGDQFYLQIFDFSNCSFTGQIAGDIAGFSAFNLRIIRIGGNQLTTNYQILCTAMPRLEELDVSGNLIQGTLSTDMKNCHNMTSLTFTDNYFEGTLPSELGSLSNLKEIDVSGNRALTGTIPTEYGLLSHLSLLNITGTSLVGEVPNELCAKVRENTLNVLANCSSVQCCKS